MAARNTPGRDFELHDERSLGKNPETNLYVALKEKKDLFTTIGNAGISPNTMVVIISSVNYTWHGS